MMKVGGNGFKRQKPSEKASNMTIAGVFVA